MSNELELVERQLRPLTPHFAEALNGSGLAPDKLIRTILVSLEKTPTLLECSRQSIIQAAMTAAVLGLEASGPLGQFYMIPFKGKATPVIGYRGFATIAGRSGFTINGAVVKEGDLFEYELGSHGFVRHRPQLGAGQGRRIIASWATASRPGHAPIVQILDIDEIVSIKARSPGASMKDSPWRDEQIGFSAMATKSAIRRLARTMPLNLMTTAAALDEAVEERGRHAFIDPHKGLIVDGQVQEIAPAQPGGAPSVAALEKPTYIIRKKEGPSPDATVVATSREDWRAKMMLAVSSITSRENLEKFRDLNAPYMDLYRPDPKMRPHVDAVGAAIEKKLRS